MRFLVLFFLFFIFLYAKSDETCYSVALLTAVDNDQNKLKLLKKYSSSDECKILTIGKMLSVRCGCYDEMSNARQKLEHFKQKGYKHILITPTYKYRFEKILPKKIAKAPQLELNATLIILKPLIPKIKKELVREEPKKEEQHEREKEKENIPTIESSELENMQTIDVTLIGRYVSNKNFYRHEPYFFALFESEYEAENFTISGGVGYQSREKNEELLINHLSFKYFGDNYTFKIGKMVEKAGVMDYFSMLDTFNPSREEFFYDSQLNIKKIPLWMSTVDYFVNDEIKLSVIIQPYDTKHANYRGLYVDYILNQFIPEYYKDVFAQEPLGQEVFYPVYTNAVTPYLIQDINNKSQDSKIYLDKPSFGFVAEYSDDSKKVGFSYYNRYSEIPLIKVDQNLLDAAIAYDNGENPSEELVNYLQSADYEPIKSVDEFRYQQYGLYAETTFKSYGIRGEVTYRDKLPLFNSYGSLSSIGFAIDHASDLVYNVLETQYLYLDKYHKSAYISMLRTRFKKHMFSVFSGYFENSLIASKVDTLEEYSIIPSYTISYKQVDLSLQGLVSKNNTKTNTFSLLLRGRF